MPTPQMSAYRRTILARSREVSVRQRPPYTYPDPQLSSSSDQGGRSNDGAKIEVAYINYRRDFQNRLGNTQPLYESLFTVIDDPNPVNKYIWLNKSAKMRKWTGEKQLHKARAESQPIVVDPYEASELVPKHDVINDRFGLYADFIMGLADSYDKAIDELAFAFLVAGIAGTSLGTTYDGQTLIDTDHTMRSADAGIAAKYQSNLVGGALSQSVFVTALQRFNNMKDEFGNPLAVVPRYLVCGPANEHAAKLILEQERQATGESNLYVGGGSDQRITRVISPRITGTQWALLPANSASIIIHRKRPPEFLAVDNPQDSWVFDTGMFKYGIESEQGAAYGLWQEIVGGPGS